MMLILAFLLAAAPTVSCEMPVVDLGTVRSGPPAVATFRLVNSGTAPVKIAGVEAGCGCVRRDVSKSVLAPGEAGTVTLTINTLTQPEGPNSWRASAVTDAGPVELLVKANLVREIAVSPPAVGFSTATGATQTLTVTDRRAKPLTVTKTSCTSPHLSASISPPATTGDRVQKIELVLAPDSPPGEHEETVSLFTDDPTCPELRVPVKIAKRVAGTVTAAPAAVDLTFAAGQTELSSLIQLRAGGNPVRIAEATCDHPGVKLKWAEASGRVGTLRVTVVPGAKGTVRVKFAEPPGAELTIPVRGDGGSPGSP